jgi:hypothetical protein
MRKSGDVLREIEKALATKLAENGIKAEVYGREKRPYSIWRKMERKHLSLGHSRYFRLRVSLWARWTSATGQSALCTGPGGPFRAVQGLHLNAQAE